MPLVKCTDCGKMVSNRIANCPFCGCPANFFEKVEAGQADNEENGKEERKLSTLPPKVETKQDDEISGQREDKLDQQNKNQEITFSFAGIKFTYPQGSEQFATLFGTYLKLGDEGVNSLTDIYCKAGEITEALKTVPNAAEKILSNVIKGAVDYLYKSGINFTEGQFRAKYYDSYNFEYESRYDVVKNTHAAILDYEADLKKYRDWEKTDAKTDAKYNKNLVKNFVQSSNISAEEKNDAAEIRSKLKTLYEDSATKDALCNGIKISIINVYKALSQELREYKVFPATIDLDRDKAIALYQNTLKHEKDERKIRQNITQSILYYPGEKMFYSSLMEYIISYAECEFADFMKFWNIEYLYPDFREEQEKGNEFDQFLSKRGIDKFNFGNINEEQYILLHGLLSEYFGAPGIREDFCYSVYSPLIKEFLHNINVHNSNALCTYKIFDWISTECSPTKFINSVRCERAFLPAAKLNKYWLFGDDEIAKRAPSAKVKRGIVEGNDKLLLYYDFSVMQGGTKGIALTEKYIVNLKDKIKLDISKVNDITVYDNLSIKIYDKVQSITFKENVFANDPFTKEALHYLAIMLKIFCVRYGNNNFLWCEKMNVPKPE